MAPARQMLALLALLGAGFFLLACGSSDEPQLEGEPFSVQESEDLTNALTALEEASDANDCGEAEDKLAALQQAVDDMPEERDAELRSALTEGLDQLGGQIDEECQEVEPTTSSTTTEETVPTTTEPEPTTTTEEESTTTTEEEEEPTTTEEEKPPPPGPPPGGGEDDGSGGTSPGGFEAGRKAEPEKASKPGKGPKQSKGAKKVKQR